MNSLQIKLHPFQKEGSELLQVRSIWGAIQQRLEDLVILYFEMFNIHGEKNCVKAVEAPL